MIIYFYLILIIYCITAFISGCSFLPNTSNDSKSEDKIEEDKVYSELFLKNFPYLDSYTSFGFIKPILYFVIFYLIDAIEFLRDSKDFSFFIYSLSLV